MEATDMNKWLDSGEYIFVESKGKSFAMVYNEEIQPTGFVQCRKCRNLLKYDAKRTELYRDTDQILILYIDYDETDAVERMLCFLQLLTHQGPHL